MKLRILSLALLSSITIAPAFAADLPRANSPEIFEAPVAGTYFSGPYAGISGGFGAASTNIDADANWTYDDSEKTGTAHAGSEFGANLGIFGLNAGYDFRIGKLVVGPVARYNWMSGATDASVSINDFNLATGKFEYNNEWGLGGRIGLLMSEKTIVYTGLLYSQMETTGSYSAFDGNYSGSKDYTFNGYAVLAGMETMITPQLSLKIEGEYATYGKETLWSYSDTGINAAIVAEPAVYDVKIGLTYRPDFGLHSLK